MARFIIYNGKIVVLLRVSNRLKFDHEILIKMWNSILKFYPEIWSLKLTLKFDFGIWPWNSIDQDWNFTLKFDHEI